MVLMKEVISLGNGQRRSNDLPEMQSFFYAKKKEKVPLREFSIFGQRKPN